MTKIGIRIEKPQAPPAPVPASTSELPPRLNFFFKSLFFLAFLFSTAVLCLVWLAGR